MYIHGDFGGPQIVNVPNDFEGFGAVKVNLGKPKISIKPLPKVDLKQAANQVKATVKKEVDKKVAAVVSKATPKIAIAPKIATAPKVIEKEMPSSPSIPSPAKPIAQSGGPVETPKVEAKTDVSKYEHPVFEYYRKAGFHGIENFEGPLDDAIAKAKADIQKQLDAAKAKVVSDAQKQATTAATNLITKASTAAQSTISKGIATAAGSKTAQDLAVKSGEAAGQATLSKADELKQKYAPGLAIAGKAAIGLGAVYLVWKLVQIKKAVSIF